MEKEAQHPRGEAMKESYLVSTFPTLSDSDREQAQHAARFLEWSAILAANEKIVSLAYARMVRESHLRVFNGGP